MLSHYRILDLTDDRGHFAGFLLAQLGADVIAVEPPEGQRSRLLPHLPEVLATKSFHFSTGPITEVNGLWLLMIKKHSKTWRPQRTC